MPPRSLPLMLALAQFAVVLGAAPTPRHLEFGSTKCTDAPWKPMEPSVPGVMPGIERPKLLLAQDIDWPPYAYLANPPEGNFEVAGFGHDVALGLSSVCDIDVVVTEADWDDCWTNSAIGDGAKAGVFHGCMTYTHTIGSRPRYMEFSHSILEDNKPAGLISLLDDNGVPLVSSKSTLDGLKVVDVVGWAPTTDGLAITENTCANNALFSGYEFVFPTDGDNANDAAMQMLQNGEADAMWVYADQAHTYDCNRGDVQSTWNCTLWEGLGTKYAYIHTGFFGHTTNGTTLTMSKRGSGVADIVNPCIAKFLQTKEYYDVCAKHGLESSCYKNAYFPNGEQVTFAWELPTNEQTGGCASGYCGCEA